MFIRFRCNLTLFQIVTIFFQPCINYANIILCKFMRLYSYILRNLLPLMPANYSILEDSYKSGSRKHYFLWRCYSVWCITQSTFVNACLSTHAVVSWIIYENYNIFTFFLFSVYDIIRENLYSSNHSWKSVGNNRKFISKSLRYKIRNYVRLLHVKYDPTLTSVCPIVCFTCYESNTRKYP